MAALKSIGILLQSSRWTSALVEAGIASSGIAEHICQPQASRKHGNTSDHSMLSIQAQEISI